MWSASVQKTSACKSYFQKCFLVRSAHSLSGNGVEASEFFNSLNNSKPISN